MPNNTTDKPKKVRRHSLVFAISVGVILAGGAVGGAYALTSGASSGSVAPARSAHTLRADFTSRLISVGQRDLAPAPGAPFNTLRASVDGREWSFSSYRNTAGQQCMLEAIPGEGRGYGCQDAKTLFIHGPLYLSSGSRQEPNGNSDHSHWDAAWVEGFAASPVTFVELLMTNCATIPLPLNADGAFFGLVGKEAMHGRFVPYAVQGRDASGGVVQKIVVELGPTSGKTGKVAAPPAPRPEASC